MTFSKGKFVHPNVELVNDNNLRHLQSSAVIEVEFEGEVFGQVSRISLPEVLACYVSSRFRDLCNGSKNRCFKAELLNRPLLSIEMSSIFNGIISRSLKEFGKWLYGASISFDEIGGYAQWIFGQTIGCPFFQNDIIRTLCLHRLPEVKKISHFDSMWDRFDPAFIWTLSDFTPDKERGYDSKSEVYWGNKQMLRFVLDVFAFVGTEDEEVREVFSRGDTLAIHLASIMNDAIQAGGFDGAPWDEKNIKKYLVDEGLPNE